MIVNPQVFNYRLTIGTLIVTLAVLATFSFSSYSSYKSEQDFLEQEKKLLQYELTEIIDRYDELDTRNSNLKSQLNDAKARAIIAFDSLKKVKVTASFVSSIKGELMFLKKQNKALLNKDHSLTNAYNDLVKERDELAKSLDLQSKTNLSLKQENANLRYSLNEASKLVANSFEAKAFKQKRSNKIIETNLASEANNLEVCFVVAENLLVPKGDKELYIQVIDPENNVLSDQGAVEFNDFLLIYSTKSNINYDNEVTEVCTTIASDENLIPGIYYISVFENERRLGGTQIELN